MKNITLTTLIAFLCVLSLTSQAQDSNMVKKYYHNEPLPTEIKIPSDTGMTEFRSKFIGTHKITLQWLQNLDRDNAGKMTVAVDSTGKLLVDGYQEEMNNRQKNFMRLKGEIFLIDEKTLLFNGKIEIRVDYTDKGNTSVREGYYIFKKMGKRKYFRMQNGRDVFDQVEYIDIY